MDHRLVWSPEAVEDIESIAEYIARDSVFYARSVVDKILKVAKNIADFPYTGRMVPEYGDHNIRERLIYNYRLVYQVDGNKITVIAIIHGKRMLEPAVNERIKKDE